MSRAELAGDRAAKWIISQEEGDWTDADQAEFDAWLGENDGNKAAYWRLRHSWRQADRIGALSRGTVGPDSRSTPTKRIRRLLLPIAASVAAAFVLGYGTLHQTPAPSEIASAKYRTPVGGLQTVALPDGSRVQLNTASFVHASVTAEHREVWIDNGEAFFEVAHLNGKPFIVHAGNRQITVLGTKFSVRRDGDKVTVMVLEGRVRVDELQDNLAIRSSVIVGGDIALAEGPATLVTTRSEERVESALAWRTGMLNFDQTPLSDAAAEFNRYNVKQMVVTDPGAANIRIGGVFPASSPEAFVRLLHDAYGLHIENTTTGFKIST